MKNPVKKKFKVGDLVYTTWESGNQVFETYEENRMKMPTFRFDASDIGMVLELHQELNNVGIRIAVGTKTGWTNAAFYDKVGR